VPATPPSHTPSPSPAPSTKASAIDAPHLGGLDANAALAILGMLGVLTLGAMAYVIRIGHRG
jgi:hypothetical protein